MDRESYSLAAGLALGMVMLGVSTVLFGTIVKIKVGYTSAAKCNWYLFCRGVMR